MNKKNLKEDRFNEIYGGKGYTKKAGVLSWLASHLRQYAIGRSHVVFELLEKGDRLLDVGCGDGDFCIMAKESFDSVYGIDVSSVRIKNAHQKINERSDKAVFTFVEHDIDEGLPFPDNYFNTVTCMVTLECLLYPSLAIEEMRRVLKPKGILIVAVANIAFLPYRLTLLVGKLPAIWGIDEIGYDWDRLHSFTPKFLETFLISRGFEIVASSCSGIFAKIRRVWPSLLAGDIIVKARKVVSNKEAKVFLI